ncbi:hypothetical protein Cgig2_011077 [Carnegiea gigantea]|uniref:Uncharacterized protein n=1 Tax=Carnegiea gigantea TaxID=171969 RepID=A0A9Q1JSA2_9CARY|nr:hypothetical protein Cgig2_011077 [Carnegiea gigantea]
MVQAIFYATILNDAAELGLECRLTMDYMMWERRMAKTKYIPCTRTPDELLAEGTIKGNFCSVSSSQKPRAEVLSTNSSSSLARTSTSSSSDRTSTSCSSDGMLASSSSTRVSTSSSSRTVPNAPRRAVVKKRECTQIEPVLEIVAEGAVFCGAPSRSDPMDRLSIHFPNPKVVPSLKRTTLEKKYLLPAGYSFVIPEVDATVNKSPPKCIVIYRVAFNYGVRFPLHPVIMNILNKFKLAPTQIVPTSSTTYAPSQQHVSSVA